MNTQAISNFQHTEDESQKIPQTEAHGSQVDLSGVQFLISSPVCTQADARRIMSNFLSRFHKAEKSENKK